MPSPPPSPILSNINNRNMGNDVMSFNFDVIIILPIYSLFCNHPEAVILQNWKQNKTFFKRRFRTIVLSKAIVSVQKCWFFVKKTPKLAKLRRPWYWKVNFLKLHKCVYLRTKFQVSVNILINLRTSGEGAGVVSLPHSRHRGRP